MIAIVTGSEGVGVVPRAGGEKDLLDAFELSNQIVGFDVEEGAASASKAVDASGSNCIRDPFKEKLFEIGLSGGCKGVKSNTGKILV